MSSEQTAVYEDQRVVVECKGSKWGEAEVNFYNRSGDVISHFKRADPSSLDLSSIGQPVNPNSIVAIAQHLLCNKQLSASLLPKAKSIDSTLSYFSPTAAGDGEIFHGPIEPIADSSFPFEVVLGTKFHQDKDLASTFPGQTVLGVPPGYRTAVSRIQVGCTARKVKFIKTEYYDSQNNLVYIIAPIIVEPLDVKNGPLTLPLDLVCTASGSSVEGTYEGTNKATYKGGGESEQKITINVTQSGDDVTISFQTPNGSQGKGNGKLSGDTVKPLTLQSTTPGCSGSYEGSLKFDGDTMHWSYEGKDCGGLMDGSGTAKRTKA